MESVRRLGVAVIDPWCAVDPEERLLEHSPAFRELFSREEGRKLVGRRLSELVGPEVAESVLRGLADGPRRLHEQEVALGGGRRRFLLGAAPLEDGGAVLFLRDVTEEAQLQERYQKMEEQIRRTREELEVELDERTRDLLTANDLINRLERELARYKRGEI